jgi:hypothetical protein
MKMKLPDPPAEIRLDLAIFKADKEIELNKKAEEAKYMERVENYNH